MRIQPYVVIDACVAGAWIFQEEFTVQALPVLNAIEQYRVIPVVPDRFFIEVLRICQKKVSADNERTVSALSAPPISADNAMQRFQFVIALSVLTEPTISYAQVWQVAQEARVTVHDALYLALAREWNVDLWTLDAGLAATAATFSFVHDLRTAIFPY